jgi:hypothetical protein
LHFFDFEIVVISNIYKIFGVFVIHKKMLTLALVNKSLLKHQSLHWYLMIGILSWRHEKYNI